jgi:hypothetical protein
MESKIVDKIIDIYHQKTNIKLDKKEYSLYNIQYCGGRPKLDIDGYMLIMQLNDENSISIEVVYSKTYNLDLDNLVYQDSYYKRYRLNDFINYCLNINNLVNFDNDFTPTDGMWGKLDHWHYWKYKKNQ